MPRSRLQESHSIACKFADKIATSGCRCRVGWWVDGCIADIVLPLIDRWIDPIPNSALSIKWPCVGAAITFNSAQRPFQVTTISHRSQRSACIYWCAHKRSRFQEKQQKTCETRRHDSQLFLSLIVHLSFFHSAPQSHHITHPLFSAPNRKNTPIIYQKCRTSAIRSQR
jgi:hypothetical protein